MCGVSVAGYVPHAEGGDGANRYVTHSRPREPGQTAGTHGQLTQQHMKTQCVKYILEQ